ncbi:RER1-like protein [Sarcoptes scabiei]|uniref:Large ribosomal subunit protein uL30m n=1 Tax=Sarcoptes scabiei TaxID=52283 RepID=A0A834VES9_SARSC|nr:RER1-like protein [Sarcoptes scabiei]
MSFISQFTRQSRSYIYHRVYKGPFEYKKKDTQMSQYPFVNHNDLQKKFKEIHEIRSRKLNDEDVSPFHLVWRYKSFYGNHWTLKLILRRLGLHQTERNIPVVIPNTPHYNQMLWEIKHLIRLKPLKFPDGIPTEEDIGNVKIDLNTGELRINPANRIPQESLMQSAIPPIFSGKYLREYLKWSSGLVGRGLPHHEVDEKCGNHIEKYDKKMRTYYDHQHKFYQ